MQIIQKIHGETKKKTYFLTFIWLLDSNRQNPFGLLIILNSNGDAEGDLFYDDGESINSIATKSYYYSKFKWSSSNRQLSINIIENNYLQMSNLILDRITIYGLTAMPTAININHKQFYPRVRPFTQIVDITDFELPMNINSTLTWSNMTSMIVQFPKALLTNSNYRVDCCPDSS